MARVRNNQGQRNKILNVFKRPYLEQENTQEREGYLQARETVKPLQDKTWQVAEKIVRRHYTDDDVKKARYLQDKFDNVDTIASDSCFHLGYMGKAEERDDNDNFKMVDKRISHHFDFKIDGGIGGQDNGRHDHDFGYAYFRDELKAQENCNPDINIEMADKERNPHQTKFQDANAKYLGTNGGEDNQTSYARQWNNDYELDLIGREYCRDRQIGCDQKEFAILMTWQQAKSKLIKAHTKWVETILEQCKLLKNVLRDHTYLEQSIELANKMGITLNESNILATTSKGIVVSNQDVLNHLTTLKNKTQTRDQKILARQIYDQAQAK